MQVKTSHISLDVFARKGRVLGDLFCALSRAKVTFPARRACPELPPRRPVTAGLRDLAVVAPRSAAPGAAAVLPGAQAGPGAAAPGPARPRRRSLRQDAAATPWSSRSTRSPTRGLLGQLLCGLAGGGGVTDLAGLQSLLSSLGVNLSTAQLQGLLNQLGIANLSGGLTQLDLNRILAGARPGRNPPPPAERIRTNGPRRNAGASWPPDAGIALPLFATRSRRWPCVRPLESASLWGEWRA